MASFYKYFEQSVIHPFSIGVFFLPSIVWVYVYILYNLFYVYYMVFYTHTFIWFLWGYFLHHWCFCTKIAQTFRIWFDTILLAFLSFKDVSAVLIPFSFPVQLQNNSEKLKKDLIGIFSWIVLNLFIYLEKFVIFAILSSLWSHSLHWCLKHSVVLMSTVFIFWSIFSYYFLWQFSPTILSFNWFFFLICWKAIGFWKLMVCIVSSRVVLLILIFCLLIFSDVFDNKCHLLIKCVKHFTYIDSNPHSNSCLCF